MTPAAQRRGAICAALGAVACASLLVLWDYARDPAATQPIVQGDRSDQAVIAFAAPEQSLTRPPPSTSRVGGDPSSEATGLDDRDPLGALIVALGDTDVNVRMDAVSDLGLLRDTQVESLQVESLLVSTALQDPAPLVRVEALYALETLGAESQLATFRHALDDPDEDVRKAAISALEELGSDASGDALTDVRTAR